MSEAIALMATKKEREAFDVPRWFAVHCQPNSENKAATFLQRQGYRTFYPFCRYTRYVGRQRRMREDDLALLSRYIFVAFQGREHESIGAVNATFGVSTVVYVGDEPISIDAKVIDALMAITDEFEDQGIRRWLVDNKRLAVFTNLEEEHWFKGQPGDQIRLGEESAFFGLVAELSSIKNLDKRGEIAIWLNVFGGVREVTVHVSEVATVIPRDRSKPALPVADVAGGGRLRRA